MNHIVVWGSIIFTFVFNYIYCAIDTQQRRMDTLYVMQRASSRAEFWFVLVVTPIIALLPRYGQLLYCASCILTNPLLLKNLC